PTVPFSRLKSLSRTLLANPQAEVVEMFANLIETSPRKAGRASQLILSIAIHTILISGAVYGTLQAKDRPEKPVAEIVQFSEIEPTPTRPEHVDVAAPRVPPKGF